MPRNERPTIDYPRQEREGVQFVLKLRRALIRAIDGGKCELKPLSFFVWGIIAELEDANECKKPVPRWKDSLARTVGLSRYDKLDPYLRELREKGLLHEVRVGERHERYYWVTWPDWLERPKKRNAESESMDLNSRSLPSAMELPPVPAANKVFGAAILLMHEVAPRHPNTGEWCPQGNYSPNEVWEFAFVGVRLGGLSLINQWVRTVNNKRKGEGVKNRMGYLRGIVEKASSRKRFDVADLLIGCPEPSDEQMAELGKPLPYRPPACSQTMASSTRALLKTLGA